MNGTGARTRLPDSLRGIAFVHPWILPWFAIVCLIMGIPGTLHRPLESWLAVSCGIAICVTGATVLWFTFRNKTISNTLTWFVVITQIAVIAAAGLASFALNPVASFFNATSSPTESIDTDVSIFLAFSIVIVWVLTWTLVAILVTFQRAYRTSRRNLLATSARLTSASEQFTREVLEPIRTLELEVASQLNLHTNRLNTVVSGSTSKDFEKAREIVEFMRDSISTTALKTLASISLDEDSPAIDAQRPRVAITRVAPRWNGQYFSGLVGALIIGIVAIASSASVNVTSPGFFVQIPLIMVAFFLSVPSALFLFFAAALTPFLGPNSNASENYVLFAVIVVLAGVSLLQRANEVRQLRNLESLTVANGSLALELVSFRQEANDLKKRLKSVLHGKVQSTLIVAENHLNARNKTHGNDMARVVATLREASAELSDAAPNVDLDFAASVAQIVGLWDGSMNVIVSIAPNAKEILLHDSHAAATAIEVISEGTLNAAKHASTSKVHANISAEGHRLRISVTNERSTVESPSKTDGSTRVGLEYLRQLTSELRLESSDTATTLFAEIPSRVALSELSSR